MHKREECAVCAKDSRIQALDERGHAVLRICHEELLGLDKEIGLIGRALETREEERKRTLENIEIVLTNKPHEQVAVELDEGLWAAPRRF